MLGTFCVAARSRQLGLMGPGGGGGEGAAIYGSIESPPEVRWKAPMVPTDKPAQRRNGNGHGTKALAGALSLATIMLCGLLVVLQKYDDTQAKLPQGNSISLRSLLYRRQPSHGAVVLRRASRAGDHTVETDEHADTMSKKDGSVGLSASSGAGVGVSVVQKDSLGTPGVSEGDSGGIGPQGVVVGGGSGSSSVKGYAGQVRKSRRKISVHPHSKSRLHSYQSHRTEAISHSAAAGRQREAASKRGSMSTPTLAAAAVAAATASSSQSTGSSSAAGGDGSYLLEFSVSNKYGAHVSKDASSCLYPWLQGKKLIEPHTDTMLSLTKPASGVLYLWTIAPKATNSTDTSTTQRTQRSVGTSVKVNLKKTGLYTIQVEVMGANTREPLAVSREDAYVKYVRRELRSLTKEDRDAFFDAANTLWNVSTSEGQAKYGTNYRDIHYFAGYHLSMAAQKTCDHMHDGLGFMTEHLALTLRFEETLRLVDARVSMPYWDFTIDTESIRANHGGEFSKQWFKTELFSDDYFGAVDPAEHTVTKGRWAYKRVGQGNTVVHNGYKMLRAPWNNNPSSYVTRVSSFCGYDWDDTFPTKMPDCKLHYNILAGYNNWTDFGSIVSYDPHGGVHALTGGSYNCDDMYSTLQEKIGLSDTFSQWFSWWTYGLQRAWWRSGLMTCPTDCSASSSSSSISSLSSTSPSTSHIQLPAAATSASVSSCRCSCSVDDLLQRYNNSMDQVLSEMLNGDTTHLTELTSLSDDKKLMFASMVCDSTIMVGDQIEASSPYDISFWPIHPTVERLWQAKKLRGLFTSESWPDGSSHFSSCMGHNSNSRIPIEGLLDMTTATYSSRAPSTPTHTTTAAARTHRDAGVVRGGMKAVGTGSSVHTGAEGMMTNMEMYELMDPTEPNMPHIYDDFTWGHCLSDVGIDFTKVVAGELIGDGAGRGPDANKKHRR